MTTNPGTVLKLQYATVTFNVKFTPQNKTHWNIDGVADCTFSSKEEYLIFLKSWKLEYKKISKAIRLLKRPVGFICSQSFPSFYLSGRYHWPTALVFRTLFSLRMMAKALLFLRSQARTVAINQHVKSCDKCNKLPCP
jgi:hypothetical protein